jgi:protein ImuA
MPRDTLSPDTIAPHFFQRQTPKGAQQMEDLRARIRALERPGWTEEEKLFSLGLPEIDRQLPAGGFLPAALYEVLADQPVDASAASGFCITLLAALANYRKGRILWCLNDSATDAGEIYPPGITQHGLDPSLLTIVRTTRDTDVLWAMEEALRSKAFIAVLGEIKGIPMTASRRLQLAAEENDALALLLRPATQTPGLSAAVQRWRIKASSSHPRGFAATLNEPGAACWHATLFRSRGGTPGAWLMEWCDETDHLALASPVCDRPVEPHNASLTG